MSDSIRESSKEAGAGPDVFDFVGRKLARHLVETLESLDGFADPFRAGGIQALEEFWFRATGHHLDWEQYKITKPAASTGTLVCHKCGGSGVVLGPRLLGARGCPVCHATAPSEPGSAEQLTGEPTLENQLRWKTEDLRRALESEKALYAERDSLRAQLQEREREIERLSVSEKSPR